jgi:hypothetical protein
MRAGRWHPRSVPANGHKGPKSNTTPNRAVETASAGMVERRRHDASSFPSCDAPHKFKVAGDKGPSKLDGELRRHIYPRAGLPVRVKIKLERYGETGFQNWYAVTRDGVAGWQAQKPAQYVSVPYVGSLNTFDSELTSDALMWPEGEKDVDTLTRLDVPAFTFGGTGDGLPGDIESYLKDRHLVILADNDQAGRDHAEKKAALAHSMGAASIKIVHFPELPEKNDVSDFIEGGVLPSNWSIALPKLCYGGRILRQTIVSQTRSPSKLMSAARQTPRSSASPSCPLSNTTASAGAQPPISASRLVRSTARSQIIVRPTRPHKISCRTGPSHLLRKKLMALPCSTACASILSVMSSCPSTPPKHLRSGFYTPGFSTASISHPTFPSRRQPSAAARPCL